MNAISKDVDRWYEVIREQTLSSNDNNVFIWSKYKNDLQDSKSLLSLIPQKMKHNVMVPIGPKALVRGQIVHTNEFLVNLGETWFVKRTAIQTIDICNRRMKTCDEMLRKLEKEKELLINKSVLPAEQEAFGSEERPEIIEYLTEKENEEWMKQHRIREKKYRQQLSELRNKETKSIKSEEDLWKHLDELELQEELEDELNRLNAEFSSGEDDSESFSNEISEQIHKNDLNYEGNKVLQTDKSLKLKNNPSEENVPKRKVSYACDINSSDDEPLKLEIKHSDLKPFSNDSRTTEISSPSDIYKQYLDLDNKILISALKNKVNPNIQNEFKKLENVEGTKFSEDVETQESNEPISTYIQLKDIIERNLNDDTGVKKDYKPKKISKFKALRTNIDLK